jgi:hypothetical protein
MDIFHGLAEIGAINQRPAKEIPRQQDAWFCSSAAKELHITMD